MNAVGSNVEFGGIPQSNALKVLQIELFSIGQIEPEDGSYDTFEKESDNEFCRFVFRDSHLVGAILIGDAKLATKVKKAVESKCDFSGNIRIFAKNRHLFGLDIGKINICGDILVS
ncbi:hypothetical protein ES703_74529 [subsurface metagenome]